MEAQKLTNVKVRLYFAVVSNNKNIILRTLCILL